VGVKVTLCEAVPAFGLVVGTVKANEPAGVEAPPDSVEEASVWPYVIELAVGHVVTDDVALFTVTLAVPVNVL
jgi:hypothetical protein